MKTVRFDRKDDKIHVMSLSDPDYPGNYLWVTKCTFRQGDKILTKDGKWIEALEATDEQLLEAMK